jgi:hypothetical protein
MITGSAIVDPFSCPKVKIWVNKCFQKARNAMQDNALYKWSWPDSNRLPPACKAPRIDPVSLVSIGQISFYAPCLLDLLDTFVQSYVQFYLTQELPQASHAPCLAGGAR